MSVGNGMIKRFTVKGEKIVGAQLVGDVEDAGLVSAYIKNEINTKELGGLKLNAPEKHIVSRLMVNSK